MISDERINKLFEWMKVATKPERHIPEIEDFAKNNPKVFGDFHRLSGMIINGDDAEAKEKIRELVNNNEEEFNVILNALNIN